MKRAISVLIGCSLALAGVAMAQQPEQQSTPGKKKQQQQAAEKVQPAQGQPGANAPKGGKQARAQGLGAANQPGATTEQAPGKGRKGRASQESANVAGQPSGGESPGATTQQNVGKGRKARAESANTAQTGANVSGQPGANVAPGMQPQGKGKKGRAVAAEKAPSPATTSAGAAGAMSNAPAGAPPTPAPSESIAAQQNTQAMTGAGGKAKKADPQQVQQIKAQHANFRAQPKPQQVPAVTFNQNNRIQGSEQWTAPQYQVFRSYRPQWHDEGWYRSHYGRVDLIGGGYYYFNNGYWYPAWGYNPSAAYYAYDGPIYVGHRAEPPDKVIADVQAELQQMGYYRGEVDGLLGPLTREALAAYQADNGLTQTAAIDEPTLDSLQLS